MRTPAVSLITILSLLPLKGPLFGAEPTKRPADQAVVSTSPFTGRTTRNRIRLRAGADLNSPILKELEQGELVGVVGEEDSFYAVKPPKEIKAYIYRTYVLENTVDGSQVNVRLEPNLESPIIAQLNKGDHVEGKVSAQNSQWLEISLPANVKFYISKDFVEKAGPADLYARTTQHREEANQRVAQAYLASQLELQKPQEQMQLDRIVGDLKHVIEHYADVPTAVSLAKTYLANIEGSYQHKQAREEATPEVEKMEIPRGDSLAAWLPKEAKLFEEWLADHPHGTMDDFYAEQRADAVQLRGIIQPYTRPVKNRPGDYLLVNHTDQQPIAFLYSTQVNLKPEVGKVVTVVAVPRPNNNFAFPTFFVVSTQ
jgi:hypothetical protein